LSSHPEDPHVREGPEEADDLLDVRLREWTGSIYWVPDRMWGFELVLADGHPGVCLGGDAQAACFVQGTGVENDWNRNGRERVLPSAENGLHKETSFRLEPRRFRWKRVVLLHPERFVGRLDDADYERLRRRLDALLDVEAGH